MPKGPGKYDDLCSLVRERSGGEVIVIVIGGDKGSGFSFQGEEATLEKLPKVLERVAELMRVTRAGT
jgi:hypothetical protein